MIAKPVSLQFLCLALAASLTACQSLPPPSKPPTPPDVRQCREGWGPDVQPVPVLAPGAPLTDVWVKSIMSWANSTVGVVTTERQLRSQEHACEDKLAEKKIIR